MIASPAARLQAGGLGSHLTVEGQYVIHHHPWTINSPYPSSKASIRSKPKKAKKATQRTTPGRASAGAGQASPVKGPIRRRISRACDQCNQLRTKCDGKKPCAHCTEFGLGCQYAREQKKRGKASRKELAEQAAAKIAHESSQSQASPPPWSTSLTAAAAAAAAPAVVGSGMARGSVAAAASGWTSLLDDEATPTEASDDYRTLEARVEDWAAIGAGAPFLSYDKQQQQQQQPAALTDSVVRGHVGEVFGRGYSWDTGWSSTSTDDTADLGSLKIRIPAPSSSFSSSPPPSVASLSAVSASSAASSGAFHVDALQSPAADLDLDGYEMLHPEFRGHQADLSNSGHGIVVGGAGQAPPQNGYDQQFMDMTAMVSSSSTPSGHVSMPYNSGSNSHSISNGDSDGSGGGGGGSNNTPRAHHDTPRYDASRQESGGMPGSYQAPGTAPAAQPGSDSFAWTQMLPSLARYTPYNPVAFQKNDDAELDVLATDPFAFLPTAPADVGSHAGLLPGCYSRQQSFLATPLQRIS